jgi:signal transduction histidine kinase
MIQSSIKMNKQGVGLGLTICKRICESMKGWVKAESVEGEGSTFKVSVEVKYHIDSDNNGSSNF